MVTGGEGLLVDVGVTVDDDSGSLGMFRKSIAVVGGAGGAGGGEFGAAGREIHHDTTCMAAPHTPSIVRKVGGARGCGQ